MTKKSRTPKGAGDKLVRGIIRKTRKHYAAEKKIRIVLAGLRGKERVVSLHLGQYRLMWIGTNGARRDRQSG
ncbi:MAG: hypothetical protein AAFO80_14860 [Pseudomonadota bacterium]